MSEEQDIRRSPAISERNKVFLVHLVITRVFIFLRKRIYRVDNIFYYLFVRFGQDKRKLIRRVVVNVYIPFKVHIARLVALFTISGDLELPVERSVNIRV